MRVSLLIHLCSKTFFYNRLYIFTFGGIINYQTERRVRKSRCEKYDKEVINVKIFELIAK